MKSGTGANTFLFTINASNFAADLAWTLPTAAPAGNDYILRSSTAGVLSYVDPSTLGSAASDTAYAGTWDGITTVAPSKNAVYDEMELRAPKSSPTFTGSPVLPTGTTGVTQAANDNSTKLATTAYVDQMANYHRLIIDGPTTSDNVTFSGPMDRSQIIDNVVMMVQSTNGVRTGATTDNVTINFAYCAADDTAWASCTKIFTSDQTVTGGATLSPAINNPNVPSTYYLRIGISASNMSLKKLYVRIRYRSNL
jgi:hypothetical protein